MAETGMTISGLCSRDMHSEGFGPPEYPAALLDPRTCAHRLLRQLYPQSALTSRPDRDQRDRDIYRRHQAGESTEMLSKAFSLSVQRIRKIIRRLEGRA
ncbi:MAG: hypothetical protein IT322_17855 [Anaerolineae bacterium]|nr:hypothetical protein [Anaerolineae bacterium]